MTSLQATSVGPSPGQRAGDEETATSLSMGAGPPLLSNDNPLSLFELKDLESKMCQLDLAAKLNELDLTYLKIKLYSTNELSEHQAQCLYEHELLQSQAQQVQWFMEFFGQNLFCISPPESTDELKAFVRKWRTRANYCRKQVEQQTEYKLNMLRVSFFGFYFGYIRILAEVSDLSDGLITKEDLSFIRKVSKDKEEPSLFCVHALLLRAVTEGNELQETKAKFVKSAIRVCKKASDSERQCVATQLTGVQYQIGHILDDLQRQGEAFMASAPQEPEAPHRGN